MDNQNNMGSEVQKGYKCKPVVKDPDKPIMYYKNHALICTGKRCYPKNSDAVDLPEYLRTLLKESEFNRGKNRIKVTKTFCFGACRFRRVALFYCNSHESQSVNNSVWLKEVHKLTPQQWQDIFSYLASNKPINQLLDKQFLIPMAEQD